MQIQLISSDEETTNILSKKQSCLFLNNLQLIINEYDLYCLFEKFGKLIYCKISRGNNVNSLGYGFIHFYFQ